MNELPQEQVIARKGNKRMVFRGTAKSPVAVVQRRKGILFKRWVDETAIYDFMIDNLDLLLLAHCLDVSSGAVVDNTFVESMQTSMNEISDQLVGTEEPTAEDVGVVEEPTSEVQETEDYKPCQDTYVPCEDQYDSDDSDDDSGGDD